MSFGKMNKTLSICEEQKLIDEEGFSKTITVVLKTIKGYREGRHGSLKWANLSAFSDVTDLFRFRNIPHFKVTPSMLILCDDEKYEIFSVENVKGKNMYIEVLAKEVTPIGKS